MTHEPWVVVCPTTRRSIHARAEPGRSRVQPAIPAAPVPRPSTETFAPIVPEKRHAPTRKRASGASAAHRTLIGRVIGDRYGVTRLIGEGGMGEVYEAEHLALGRLVAVKVLHPKRAQDREAISRLRHEARVAGTLGHPNICAIYDMGRLDDGSPYLVMERLLGETLAQRLRREKRLVVDDLTDIVLQVLSALVAAHQRGIIHRDLKPDNIFLSLREGMAPIPKLLDFGISKAEDIEDTFIDMKDQAGAIGTPYYMAPEQARGDRSIDLRVDLWGVGVILYECLTGVRPFDAKNYNALLVEILTGTPDRIEELNPDVPRDLARIVDKALSKDPAERFQSAKELQQAMRLIRETEALPPSKRGPPTLPEIAEVAPPSQRPLLRNAPITMRPPGPMAMQMPEPSPPAHGQDAPPASPRLRFPIMVSESTSDDADSTHIFSRYAMGFNRAGVAQEQLPAAELNVLNEMTDVDETIPAHDTDDDDERTTLIDTRRVLHGGGGAGGDAAIPVPPAWPEKD